jgi:hypothetical protein
MRDAPPRRTVSIHKDPCAPLHYLRCVRPCAADNMGDPTYCMPAVKEHASGNPGCWLGSATSEHGARVLATSVGYTVQEV